MSTVEITLTGLFLVVPTGNDFTILLPAASKHPHLDPKVGLRNLLKGDIDLTPTLPRPATPAEIPPHSTFPVRTACGGRPLKSHLIGGSLPSDLKARIKVPKPVRLYCGERAKWAVGAGHLHASNKVVLEYDNYASPSLAVPSDTGDVHFQESGGLIRVSLIHAATVEPACQPGLTADHMHAYYDLIDGPTLQPIPKLEDACPPCLTALKFAQAALAAPNVPKVRRDDEEAIAELKDSLSTFTCLVGSDT